MIIYAPHGDSISGGSDPSIQVTSPWLTGHGLVMHEFSNERGNPFFGREEYPANAQQESRMSHSHDNQSAELHSLSLVSASQCGLPYVPSAAGCLQREQNDRSGTRITSTRSDSLVSQSAVWSLYCDKQNATLHDEISCSLPGEVFASNQVNTAYRSERVLSEIEILRGLAFRQQFQR